VTIFGSVWIPATPENASTLLTVTAFRAWKKTCDFQILMTMWDSSLTRLTPTLQESNTLTADLESMTATVSLVMTIGWQMPMTLMMIFLLSLMLTTRQIVQTMKVLNSSQAIKPDFQMMLTIPAKIFENLARTIQKRMPWNSSRERTTKNDLQMTLNDLQKTVLTLNGFQMMKTNADFSLERKFLTDPLMIGVTLNNLQITLTIVLTS
jgi:hypothetical protein